MPPEGYYGFWDRLMAEQGVSAGFDPGGPELVFVERPDYNVGDVIVGELVE